MKTKEEIADMIALLQAESTQPLNFDEESIAAEYGSDELHLSIAVKILSIIGGMLACITFLGLLLLFGLYDSPSSMLFLSLLFIAGGLFLNKSQNLIIFDSISVSAYISGYILAGFALSQLDFDETSIALVMALAAFVSLFINQSYVLSFLSVMLVNSCLLSVIIQVNAQDFIPLFLAGITALLFSMHKKEAAIMATAQLLSKLFVPLRLALLFSLFVNLSFLSSGLTRDMSIYALLLSTLIFIIALLALLPVAFEQLGITNQNSKWLLGSCIFVCLVPSGLNPAVTASVFILVWSFWKNYKPGIALAILGFMYFTSRFYYDLSFTLLTKSLLMLASGALLFAVYFFIHKKLEADAEV